MATSVNWLNLPLTGVIVSSLIVYILTVCAYRLFFHPLARFPGPKLAAMTYGVEMYYDLIKQGQYTWIIESMHKKYGPVVRISPSEVHVNDPDFHSDLYTGSANPRDKWSRTANLFGNPTCHFATVTDELHQARRAPLNAYFSKQSVARHSVIITSHLDKLCQRLEGCKESLEAINLKYAFAAFSLDVITEYAFGKARGALDAQDFFSNTVNIIEGKTALCYRNTFFPWLTPMLLRLPAFAVSALSPGVTSLMKIREGMRQRIQDIIDEPEESERAIGRSTVFHEMIRSDTMPESDRNLEHYIHEGQNLVSAGQLTTAYHLTVTTYHLLAHPEVFRRLRAELAAALPDESVVPDLALLEGLEYLTAVIWEGHRMSHGVPHRLQRISPAKPIVFGDWTIPAGTPTGMSNALIHYNVKLFPKPNVFNPDRFLGAEGRALRKFVVPFGRGTRGCLGQNLATAELYFALACVFRRFDLELFDTSAADVEMKHDFFVPMTKRGSQGLRVLVK